MRLRDYLPRKLKRKIRLNVDQPIPLAVLRLALHGKCAERDALVLTGTPRSGTTWLAQVLSEIPHSSVLFEPLHPGEVLDAKQAGFSEAKYVRPDATWEEGERFLARVFQGRVLNKWTTREIGLRKLFATRFLIVKLVRANRLLSWLSENAAVRSPAMIIRHPCAVVASQLRGSWADRPRPEAPEFLADYPAFRAVLARIHTPEEYLAASWAMDYFAPLAVTQPRRWQLVTYERLVSDFEEEVGRLFKAWDIEIPENVARQSRTPSSTTPPAGIGGLTGWQKRLDKDQVRRILDVTSEFGLDFYGEDVEPDYDRLHSPSLARELCDIGGWNGAR